MKEKDEEFDLIEIEGQTALFTSVRIFSKDVPKGLYKYDLREGDTLAFATIEENVWVNHAGTVLVKTPLDLGKDGYIELNEETSPNFLGEGVSLEEYLTTDYEQE